MADYFTTFSVAIKTTEEQKAWLLKEVAAIEEQVEGDENGDNELYWGITAQDDGDSVWFTGDEGPDIDTFASLMARFTEAFDVLPVTAEFAQTCSKPRLDGFGGCAFVAWRGKLKWWNTMDWTSQQTHLIQQNPEQWLEEAR